MLIQFMVKNYKSFKDETIFSLVASPIKELKEQNTFPATPKLSLLKSAVIYGANASGKTNLLGAMFFMKWFILNSSKETQIAEYIQTERFKLHTETENEPSVFEIIFMHNEIRYRYGFAVTEKKVVEEWLYYVPNKQELEVFIRKGQDFKLSRHFKSEEPLVCANRIRPNALLLSVSAQFNGDIASDLMEWFSGFYCISGLDSHQYAQFTLLLSKVDEGKKAVMEFLKEADMGIEDFNLIKTKNEQSNHSGINVRTVHKKYNNKGKVIDLVDFDMHKEESHGTKKFFEFSGPIIDTLAGGKTLIVDELDARLHPRLIRAICEMFNSKKLNSHNAQLVFVSHNTNILDKDLMRRDQIWFVEKNQYGASELFSLVEFKDPENGKKVRNDASYEKSYLNGIYGAVPCVRDLEVKYGDR